MLDLVLDFGRMAVFERNLRTGETRWSARMDRLHPDERERALAQMDAAAAQCGRHETRFQLQTPDGEVRRIRGMSEVRPGADGQPEWMIGVLVDDIAGADREEAQAASRERVQSLAQRFEVVTRAAGVGVWSIDVASGAVEWNDQMFRIWGVPPAAAAPSLEAQIDQLIHADDRALVARERARAQQAGHAGLQFEFRIVRPDGTQRWLSTWSRRERAPDDRVMAYGVTIDVTERKLAEQALRDKASAEEASRAKSEFLSRMSHELRTPLNAVLGFSQMLLHDAHEALSGRQSERVRQIHSAGQHLTALIDDVLDLAAIESTALQLDLQPVQLQAAVDDVLQWTEAQAHRAGIEVHAEPTAGWVRCDARRLRQMLANLLSNAIKYNRAGGKVWIRSSRDGDTWRLAVRDNGRGLSAEQRAHLFEPFNRLGAEREGIEGTGIGLAVVHHLAGLMGGRIEVDSEVGQGSEFRVCLSAAAAPEAALPRHAAPQPPPGATSDTHPLTVLYIEDNPINVMLVEQLMALRPAMRLLTAPDGATGVALARAARPDVLLIDMQLPDFNGFEVLSRLRADPPLVARAFIALSASAMPEEVEDAKAAGFSDYWTKPIDFTHFLDGLDTLAKPG